jgi:hypothetical protein
MALAKTGLGFPVACLANATTTIYANPATKKTYVRSLLIHNRSTVNPVTLNIHLIQNSSGSVGTASTSNRIFRLTLEAYDTYFTELAFPIVMTGTNDALVLVNTNTPAGEDLNVLLLGDLEA